MDYPLGENNRFCRRFGHRYGKMYLALNAVRQTCWLDGHTIPPWPTVPQSREDYEDWLARGKPVDEMGNWMRDSAAGPPG